MIKATIHKLVLNGALEGLTVTDTLPIIVRDDMKIFNAMVGTVRNMTCTSTKYRVVKVEYEEVAE